ncbi:MAG: peptidoglycan-binding domain-containing protein [Patescibacteria group bacterium]
MKKFLIASGVAVLAFTSIVGAQTFTFNLSVGSTGDNVVALQTALISAGFNIPAITVSGVAKGYFGSQTLAAVKLYQAAHGIPNTGFVGPLTRAALNGGVSVACPAGLVCTPNIPVAVNCPVGYTCTPIGGGTSVTGGGITTIGVEGSISAVQTNAGLSSAIYEGQTNVPVLAAKVTASLSDIRIERVKLDLGTATTIWNKIYSKIYVTDDTGAVLASSDLNSSTAVLSASNYYVTIGGMNYVIAKGATKVLTIRVDVRPSIDSTDIDTETYTIRFAANGIRGVDGAGIAQYTPAAATDITRAQNVDATLTDSATLTVSLNSSTPLKHDIIAADGSSDNEQSKLPVLTFDVKADKDNVTLTTIIVTLTGSGTGGATSTTAYLFDGSTEIGNASVAATSKATITDSNGIITIPAGTTKTLTVKADITSANGTIANVVAAIAATTDITAVNSIGDSVTVSGTATGNSIGMRNRGLEVSLVSKSISTAGAPQLNGVSTNVSTSTLTANFTVRVKAVGGSIQLGTLASSSPAGVATMFSSSTLGFKVYRNAVADLTLSSYATTTDYSAPSGYTVTNNTFTLPEGSTVDIPVSFGIMGRSATAAFTPGSYAVELESIQQNAPYAVTFMAGELDWRTSGVTFP